MRPGSVLHTGYKFPNTKTYIKNLSIKFFHQLNHVKCAQYFKLSYNKPTLRLLKCGRPDDVLT